MNAITRSIQVDSRGLHLHVYGWLTPEPTRPVVLLHGYLDTAYSFAPLARALAERLGRSVYAPDQRGHGRSDHVGAGGAYHFPDYVADLAAVIDTITSEPVDLIGHSMGGTVASLYAGALPDRVGRMVLLEGLGPPDATHEAQARMASFVQARLHPPTHPPMPDLDAAVGRLRHTHPRMPADTAQELAQILTIPNPAGDGLIWRWDPLQRGRNPTPFTTARHVQVLKAITAQVLLVDGEQSRFRPDTTGERAAAIPHATHHSLQGADHMMHFDHAPELVALIAGFLEA